MKRYYRNRIILGAMASFLFLLVIAVSGIGLSSYHQLESETDDFIASLLDGSEDRPGTFRQPPPFSFFGYTHGQRRFLSGLYDLSLSEDGRILRMDGHGLTEDEDAEATVQQLVLQALQLGADKGKIEAYKYAMRRMENGTIRFILLDMSIQLQSLYNMLENALMVSCLLLALLFLILIPISGKVASTFVEYSEKQKQFITDAGHELKTPVAIIRANLDVLELTQGKSKWSENIQGQVKRLEVLIPQMVMLSRLEEENNGLKLEPVQLSSLLEEEWQSYLPAMATKHFAQSKQIPEHLSMTGNEESLRQMFRLLMDNAVQYTPDGGTIALCVSQDSKCVLVKLKNTVDGFPAQKPEELTERFVRGSTARTQKTGGSGIGLVAVKRIVQINHGKLKIEYVEPNWFEVSMVFKLS